MTTIEQMEAFLVGSEQVAFAVYAGDVERYAHTTRMLRRYDFPRRNRRQRGMLPTSG